VFSEVTSGSTGGPIECRHVVRPLAGPGRPVEVVTGVRGPLTFWSRDGRRVYGAGYDPDKHDRRGLQDPGVYEMANWVIDLRTGKKSAVAVPAACAIRDESPDGKRFLTSELEKGRDDKFRHRYRTFITTPGAEPVHTRLAADLGDLIPLSFSPDGGRVLALRLLPGDVIGYYELLAVDVKTGVSRRLNQVPEEQGLYTACWSPDGRSVAYAWALTAPIVPGARPADPRPRAVPPPGTEAVEEFVGTVVMTVAADVTNRRRIHTEKGVRVRAIDWR
jgi:hypothetical protein